MTLPTPARTRKRWWAAALLCVASVAAACAGEGSPGATGADGPLSDALVDSRALVDSGTSADSVADRGATADSAAGPDSVASKDAALVADSDIGASSSADALADGPASSACPSGAVCFVRGAIVHSPVPGAEVRRVSFRPPAAQYSRIVVTLSVKHGGWAKDAQAVRHNIFWMAHDKRNFDLYGYANFVRPNVVLLRHGIGQVQGDKAKLTKKATLTAGLTYDLRYEYDVVAGVVDLEIETAGQPVARLVGSPNVNSIVFNGKHTLDFDFGFTGKDNPAEPATYGWVYRDLRVVMYR